MSKKRWILFLFLFLFFFIIISFCFNSHAAAPNDDEHLESMKSGLDDSPEAQTSDMNKRPKTLKSGLDDSSEVQTPNLNERSKAQMPDLDVKCKSAVLLDVHTGTLLYEQNSHEKLPPASVTKVMTMLLAMEALESGKANMSDVVTISERSAGMGGSQMYMEPGETHSIEELLMGISMVSANDACVAIAEYLYGSVEIFVEEMNSRAKELGMNDTHFENTNGLPVANHYSSAYDIAVMSCELIKYDKVKEWFNTWQANIMVGLPGKQKEFGLTNTNKLIKSYPGANGVKTGFTQDAGFCLSASATREDMTLVAVILGAESSQMRFSEASRLLDYGFAAFDSVNIAKQGQSFGKVSVEKGEPGEIDAVANQDISFLLEKGQQNQITTSASFILNVRAPLYEGFEIGTLTVKMNEEILGSFPLVADKSAKKISLPEIYIRMMTSLF